MAELVADMEDWSLQAIVRGSSGDFGKIVDIDMDGQSSVFGTSATHHQLFDQDFLASFPDIFEVSTGSSDELEELYKPFYPVTHSLPDHTVLDFQEQRQQNVAEDHKQAHDQSDQSSGTSSVASVTAAYTPKYKKRLVKMGF